MRSLVAAAAAFSIIGCGPAETPPTAAPKTAPITPSFTDVTHDLGIDLVFDRVDVRSHHMPDSMSAGCAIFDMEGDGDLDLYFVNGFYDVDAPSPQHPRGANRLYRQEPDGGFVDVTEAAGVGHTGYGMGVASGDVDNDGDLDLYVSNDGPDCLYRNNGDGTFTDVSRAAGIGNDAWSASAGFFDADGDGWLDVFVTNYLDYDVTRQGRDAAGRPEYAAPSVFDGVPDVLYRNRGDGTFADVSHAAGIGASPGRGLGVLFADLNDDTQPDVLVANDGEVNFAWINQGDFTFVDAGRTIGLGVNRYGRPEASMGIAFGDVNGDGAEDVLLSHLVQESNSLYLRRGEGQFEDATLASGLSGPSIDATGFGAVFLDVELDGDLDLAVTNGRVLRRRPHPDTQLNEHWRPYAEPDHLFLNDGTGHFKPAAAAGGAFTSAVEVGRGLAAADLDRDGDLDLVVTNGNGTVRVFRNDTPRAGQWLTVRAVDPTLSRDMLGAEVSVDTGTRRLVRRLETASSYLTASPAETHFGLGGISSYAEVRVRWPDGVVERFPGGPAGRVLVLERGAGERSASQGRFP